MPDNEPVIRKLEQFMEELGGPAFDEALAHARAGYSLTLMEQEAAEENDAP